MAIGRGAVGGRFARGVVVAAASTRARSEGRDG